MANEKPNCMSCHAEISDPTDSFECDGACNRFIHIDCTHIEKKYLPVFEKCDNAFYVCDECSVNGLKTINNKVNGLYTEMRGVQEKLHTQRKSIDELTKAIKESNELIKQLKSEREERNQTASAPSAPSNVVQPNNERKNISKPSVATNNTQASTSSNTSNEKRATTAPTKIVKKTQANKQEVKATQKQQQVNTNKQPIKPREPKHTATINSKHNVNKQTKQTNNTLDFVDKQKQCNEINMSVIIKPKQQQNSDTTMNDVQAKVNPSDVKFKRVRKTTNGCVIIDCETTNECNKLKNKVSAEMSEKYEIKSPELFKPKIKIFGLDNLSVDDSICEKLKSNNRELAKSDLKLIKVTTDRNDSNLKHVIFEIDSESFNQVMKGKKVKIGWQHYKVGHHLNLMRCFHCYGFNHQKNECTNVRACPDCGDDHESENCDASEKCCVNCLRANQKFSIQMDTKHDVWSNKCEILKRKRNQAANRVEYSDA